MQAVWFGHEPRAEPGFGRPRVCYRGHFDRVCTPAGSARWATAAASRSTSNTSSWSSRSTVRGWRGPVPQAEDVVATATRKATRHRLDRRAQPGRRRARRGGRRAAGAAHSALTSASRYGRRRDRGAGDVVAAGCRAVGGAGADRVPAGVVVGAPGDRVAAVLRRRRGRIVHRGHPAGHRSWRCWCTSPATSRASSRPGSTACSTPPHRNARLPAGLVRHHRHHPDRRVRPAVQGRNPHGRTQSVDDRDRADRVLRGDRGRRVLRQADPPRRAAHLARQRDRRPGAVPGAGARGVAVRRDDQRGPVPRAGPRAGRPVRLPAGDSGGVRLRAVLVARRLPSGRRGDERQRRRSCWWRR